MRLFCLFFWSALTLATTAQAAGVDGFVGFYSSPGSASVFVSNQELKVIAGGRNYSFPLANKTSRLAGSACEALESTAVKLTVNGPELVYSAQTRRESLCNPRGDAFIVMDLAVNSNTQQLTLNLTVAHGSPSNIVQKFERISLSRTTKFSDFRTPSFTQLPGLEIPSQELGSHR